MTKNSIVTHSIDSIEFNSEKLKCPRNADNICKLRSIHPGLYHLFHYTFFITHLYTFTF